MREKTRKNDLILFGSFILLALLLLFFQYVILAKPGAKVIVSIDGKEKASYFLSVDKEIPIEDQWGSNLLIIKDGKASIEEADCPDRLCVKQKSISLTGESLICLPHRLIITVTDGEDTSLDSVTF